MRIQQIFRLLEPYRVVSDLGYPVIEKEGGYQTVHPRNPETALRITRDGFVSLAEHCPFVAGNLYDFLALHFDGNYQKAVAHILDRYANLADNSLSASLEHNLGASTQELESARRQFERILGLRDFLLHQRGDLAEAGMWFRRSLVDIDRSWKMVYAARGATLIHLLAQSNLEADALYLVYPYFLNHFTFSRLVLRSISDLDRPTLTVSLNPAKRSFFGLHTLTAQTGIPRIYSSADEALHFHSHNSGLGDLGHSTLHIHFDTSDAAVEGMRLEAGAGMDSERMTFNTLVQARLACDRFFIGARDYIQLEAQDYQLTDWNDYILRTFQKLIMEERRYTPKVSTFVESLRSDEAGLRGLTRWLETAKSPNILAALKQQCASRDRIIVNNIEISATPHGYLAQRGARETLFTNFTLRIDRNVFFEETKQLFLEGVVYVSGNEYPFFIPENIVDKPSELEQMLIMAVRQADNSGAPPTPMVIDTTFKRYLSQIARRQAQRFSNLTGIYRLGWNSARNIFTTPTWRVRIDKIEETSRVSYPGGSLLHDFQFSKTKYPEAPTASPDASGFLAIVAAMLGRYFRSEPIPVISILRNNQTVRLLKAIFHPFGQREIVPLNLNKRGQMTPIDANFFSGFPLFTSCADLKMLVPFDYPMLVLASQGLSFQELLDEKGFSALASLSHSIFPKLVKGLISAQGRGYEVSTVTDPDYYALTLEGKRMIEAYCGIVFPVHENELPFFCSIMSRIPYEARNTFFSHTIAMETIFMYFRHMAGPSRQEIYDELSVRNSGVNYYGRNHLALPAAFGYQLLNDHYGRQVTLYDRPAPANPDNFEVQKGDPLKIVTA